MFAIVFLVLKCSLYSLEMSNLMNDYSTSMRECHLGHQVFNRVLVWRNGKKNIESFSAVTSLGRMELCKSSTCTRRSARLHRQGQLCHDPWLVTRLLVKRVMKKHIAQPMGWMV